MNVAIFMVATIFTTLEWLEKFIKDRYLEIKEGKNDCNKS